MAIYLGGEEIFDEGIHLGEVLPIGIYLDYEQVWPGILTYKLTNARVSYSSGSYINAKGSNYASIMATINVYRNGKLYRTIENAELSVREVEDTTNSFSADQDNRIHAKDRTNVTGTTRSAIYYGYYQDTSVKTGNFTIQQQSNTETRHETTTLFDISTMGSGKYTSSGWEGPIIGYREFNYYFTYTSTYRTNTIYSQDAVSATTISSSQYWAHASGTTLIIDANTSTPTDRSTIITASYGGVSDSVTLTQWRSPYYEYEYRILNFVIEPATVAWNRTGYTYNSVISGNTQRNGTLYKDGQVIPGSWSNFNDTDMLTKNNSNFKFASYDGSQKDMDYIAFQYPGATGYGYARIYAGRNNDSFNDVTATVIYKGNQAYFTQSGKAAYITVSPKTISYEAGTYYMAVDANVDWTPSSNQSWVAVSKDGNNIKCVIAEEHTGATRTATITATGTGSHSGVSGSNTLTQEAGYYFAAYGSSSIEASAGATSFGVTFRSSYGGTPYALTSSAVSLSNNTMNAVLSGITQVSGDMYLAQFTCQPNTSTTSTHNCTITITQSRTRGSKSITYNVTQAAKSYITITETYTREYTAGTFYIPVSSNVDWAVSSNQSWCTVSNNSNASVKVVVTENGSSDRYATITLTGGGVTASCTLTQRANVPMITIYIKSNDKTTAFQLFDHTGATGQTLIGEAISQGQTKTYTVPKGTVIKSWQIVGTGLSHCNFAGTVGTQAYSGVWQNTSTSITLTDGTTYNIN